MKVNNLGTGNSIEVRDAKIQRFTVAASGFISVLHGQNVNIIAGAGEPEGVRSAPVGSIYLRTTAQQGQPSTLRSLERAPRTAGWLSNGGQLGRGLRGSLSGTRRIPGAGAPPD